MSNSPLVSYTKISPNKNSPRNHAIDTISIHCVVGQCTVERIGEIFAPSSRQASSNYGVGLDGRIGMYVEEKDRSWCTSSSSNDNRAITIEVASDTTHPYAVTDAALEGLIKLLVDICQRNNIKQLLWKNDKSLIGQVDKQNMTVHRWFANKACPGEYLLNKHSYIAEEVNKRLGVKTTTTTVTTPSTSETASGKVLYRVQVGAYSKKENAENQLQVLKNKGFDTMIVNVGGLYKVQVGAYSVKANATSMQTKLKAAGFEAIIVTEGGDSVEATTKKAVEVGSTVRVNQGAKTYTGGSLASYVYTRDHKVTSLSGSRAVISYNNVVVAAMNVADLTVV